MGKEIGPPIEESDVTWIKKQHVFFHATAPLGRCQRVNVSPKSAKQFRVVNGNYVCWLDHSGSGSETAAHIIDNGRITILFVAFDGPPRILRLYGQASFILPEELDGDNNKHLRELFDGELRGQVDHDYGFRCIVLVRVMRVSQSCGYSIPKFQYTAERTTLREFSDGKGEQGMVVYRGFKNSYSIDGLPSIGQILMKQYPTSVCRENGYYFAKYDGNWLGKLQTMAKMFYIAGLSGYYRDMAAIAVGLIVGSLGTLFVCRHNPRKSLM